MGWCVRYACQRDAFTMMDMESGWTYCRSKSGGEEGNGACEHVIGKEIYFFRYPIGMKVFLDSRWDSFYLFETREILMCVVRLSD